MSALGQKQTFRSGGQTMPLLHRITVVCPLFISDVLARNVQEKARFCGLIK